MPVRVPPVDPKWPVWSGFKSLDRPDHEGVDWAAPSGEPLVAPADAVIVQGSDRAEGTVRGYNNWIWARTGDGYDWVLGHMPHDSIRVRAGDRVKAGQQVAVVGSEGQSTGPHAHLSVYRGWLDQNAPAIDPLPWIAEGSPTPESETPMTLGLDYSAGRPGGKAIKDAGYQFVVRYLSDGGPGLPGKLLTPEEAADLRANGVAIAVVWETTAGRMLAGQGAGTADAQAAVLAIKRCGGPGDRPVYFAADWDATPAQQDAINAYLRGAASVIGVERVGIYGGYWPLSRAKDAGAASWFWQTGAWSGGNRVDGHLYQRIGSVVVGGVACDVNEALADDYGQWPPDPAQAAAPITNGPQEEPDLDRLVWEQLMGPNGEGWEQLGRKSVVDFLADFRAEHDRSIEAISAALTRLLESGTR